MIDCELMQTLFHEDLIYWEAISKGAVKNQTAFKEAIDNFMKKQADKLQEILFSQNALAIANHDLRKLPILSCVHKNGKIDFSWPQEIEL